MEKQIYKLARELWVRDNRNVFKSTITWLHISEERLKQEGQWWIAQSRVALRIMRNKKREAKWEQY